MVHNLSWRRHHSIQFKSPIADAVIFAKDHEHTTPLFFRSIDGPMSLLHGVADQGRGFAAGHGQPCQCRVYPGGRTTQHGSNRAG